MNVTRSFAVAATFAAVAVGAAAPASAAPVMSGHYIKTETTPQTGKTVTSDWYFTPCGDGCANWTSPGVPPSQAHLVNGQWTMDINGGVTYCADGTGHPGTRNAHDTWDPNTLAGTVQVTQTAAVCDLPAGYTYTNNIQLTQAAGGSSPSG
jgi:hypothetical protein